MLAGEVFANDQLSEGWECEIMAFHHALALHCGNELGIDFFNLIVSILSLENQTLEIIWLILLGILRQASEEIIQSLLILDTLTQMVLEVVIDLTTFVDQILIVSVHRNGMFKDLVEVFNISLELTLDTGSEAITLLPYLHFRLEVSEALPDQLHIKDARHAFLRLTERFKFGLDLVQVEHAGSSRAAVRRTIASRALVTVQPANINVKSLILCCAD